VQVVVATDRRNVEVPQARVERDSSSRAESFASENPPQYRSSMIVGQRGDRNDSRAVPG
jgi:hypothetical protein